MDTYAGLVGRASGLRPSGERLGVRGDCGGRVGNVLSELSRYLIVTRVAAALKNSKPKRSNNDHAIPR
jgi:hypothetical protein